ELDFATGVAKWSDESCRIYGLSPEDNMHSFKSWLSFIHPDDRQRVIGEIQEAEKTGSGTSIKHRIVRPDGSIRYILSESRPEFGPDGRPVGVYGTAHDVTENTVLEQSLQASYKELETFIYRVSHDLRGPLASIQGLVRVSVLDVKDETALKHIGMIGDLAMKLDGLLTKLVHIMSVRDKKTTNDPVDVVQMVEGILSSLKFIDHFGNIKFSVNSNVKEMRTDSEALRSVLLNLVENAIKYHDYSRKMPFIDINIHRNGSPNVSIEISDNGQGIDEEVKDKVFDMFYRGTTSSKGTGLGLFIVKSTVEKLGGTITLESAKGKGSRFRLSIPVSD
ncbi:MAG TPA: PAS domain-containing sensor histidine kinase, partial [Bacteroidia bacterium]|nr:PAS domain-containing sensor histidine kinase [Bacteroidia bacterium]